jgi:chloramphenicol 3-O-phosphotransferase
VRTLDFGVIVLKDTVVADRAELDFCVALMSPRPVWRVVPAPGIEVCRQRDAQRDPSDQIAVNLMPRSAVVEPGWNAWLRRLDGR